MKPATSRWVLAGLLLGGSILNYVDRQALSLLAATIQHELHLDERDYARVVQAFSVAYGAAYLLAGRLVDRIGPRLAETIFILWWSAAAASAALATGFRSLFVTRALLGLGEPGHYAAAAATVASHFPPHQKGLAVGLYMMGGTLGAALAGFMVPALALRLGWRAVFVLVGAAGLVLAAAWLLLCPPTTRRSPGIDRVPLGRLARAPLLWLLTAARLLTDVVWYFYLYWFAKYLQTERGFSLADLSSSIWIVFVAADIGCLLGGLVPRALIARGWEASRARLAVMSAAAMILGSAFLMPSLPGRLLPIALASAHACAALAFMGCAITLPLDLFPARSIGSVQGVIGTGSAIGAALSAGLIGWTITTRSYDDVFVAMSVLHVFTAVVLWLALPGFTRRSQLVLANH